MTLEALYHSLDYVNHSREKRAQMATMVQRNPILLEPLLQICFMTNDPISIKAAWILEYTCKHQLSYLFPYLDRFAMNLNTLTLESAIRPFSKICELLLLSYYKDKNTQTIEIMAPMHKEKITEAAFDWLIGPYPVAPKAHSMTCLYLLGTEFTWIHPELKVLLEQNYLKGSAAYKARARMVLEQLGKKKG